MHLSDCFIDLIAYVTYFLRSVESRQPSFERVRGDIQRLVAASEENLKKGLVPQEDYDQARFAVFAWIDEAILASPWRERDLWLREQLQRVHYRTTDAGETFYERLGALGAHQREVREIYYLCLALGFKGRHHSDEYALEQLKTSSLKLLMGSSLGIPSLERVELFPEAWPAGSVDPGTRKRPPRWSWITVACVAGPAALFGLLFMMYFFILGHVGENFLRAVSYG
ncbi:MAG: DotU family type IV/VI secretion system protein [Syntrophaceae bacterium]|nr:DotU family type IV/VI secretion system protein [Syntrophaceae bacterium]